MRFNCSGCMNVSEESWPHVIQDNGLPFCWDCGFRLRILTSEKYCMRRAYRAEITPDGDIVMIRKYNYKKKKRSGAKDERRV